MGERSDGLKDAHEAWAEGARDYVPAYPLGNERDAQAIAKSTGQFTEEGDQGFQEPADETVNPDDAGHDAG